MLDTTPGFAQSPHEGIREALRSYGIDTKSKEWGLNEKMTQFRVMPSADQITVYEKTWREHAHEEADKILLDWIEDPETEIDFVQGVEWSDYDQEEKIAIQQKWVDAYLACEKTRARREKHPDKSAE